MGYVKPDSALVRAATDLLGRHAAQPGGACAACDDMSPCASARHAIEVRRAAGLPDGGSASDPLAGTSGGGSDVPGAGASGGAGSFGAGLGGSSGYDDGSTLAAVGASPLTSSNVNPGGYGAVGPAHHPAPVALSKD